MPTLLDNELKTYEQERERLLATAEGKFVLIRSGKVEGVFDSKMDAIAQGYEKFGNVPFLVKQIVRIEAPQNFVSKYSRRVKCLPLLRKYPICNPLVPSSNCAWPLVRLRKQPFVPQEDRSLSRSRFWR